MAVCVNPDFDYAYVKVGRDVYIMAEALVDSVLNGIPINATIIQMASVIVNKPKK